MVDIGGIDIGGLIFLLDFLDCLGMYHVFCFKNGIIPILFIISSISRYGLFTIHSNDLFFFDPIKWTLYVLYYVYNHSKVYFT